MPPSTAQTAYPTVPLLEPPTPEIISHLVSLHQRSILQDSCLMRFHPPFTATKTTNMTNFWRTRLSDAGTSASHYIFLALSPPSNPTVTSGTVSSEGRVVGIVDMLAANSDTQYFRCDVEMLLVDPDCRSKGIARRLMDAVESKARELGREMLVLNTTEGSEADLYLYPRLGYEVFGRLPGYGEAPAGQGRVGGVYYYKMLAEEGREEA